MDVPSPPPVSRLPPELLVNVFKYLAIHSNPTVLLRVCHRWADIAPSISSLWTRIDFSTPPDPFLRRSVDRPIEVILSFLPNGLPRKWFRAAREVLFSHKNRIRKLVLDLPEHLLREIEPELSAMFPVLAGISINTWRDNDPSFKNSPHSISLEHLPQIRCLRLFRVTAPWIPGQFQNLVEFILHDQWDDRFDPPMEVFLEILHSSPQLAVLSVANAGPPLPFGSSTLPPATRVVRLPNLRQLYLEQDDPGDIGWILIHLEIPVSADVRIFTNTNIPANNMDLAMGLALPNHAGLPHLANLRHCTYAARLPTTCLIVAPNFTFQTAWDWIYADCCQDFMLSFLRRVSTVGTIEDLSIIFDMHSGRSTGKWYWKQMFDILGNLRKLSIKQLGDDGLFPISNLLRCQLNSALRELWLSSIVFRGESGKGGRGGVVPGKLVDYCAERERRGNRLERLVIEAPSNAPPDLASLLAPHVDHVEVREGVLRGEDVWALELGSERVFGSFDRLIDTYNGF